MYDQTQEWLTGLGTIPIIPTLDDASVSLAREQVRQEGQRAGLPQTVTDSMVIVASELARNQLAHARHGGIAVRPVERQGVPGLEVVAADQGAGIADPARALRGGYSTAGTLGSGLSGARRLADEMDLDVRLGEGTCVWARKFATPPDRRSEVGIFGRACVPGEVSGDDGGFARGPDTLVLGVADGLGKGGPAREASGGALRGLRLEVLDGGDDPAAVLERADQALQGGRGAVMAVARLSLSDGALAHAGAGDTISRVQRPGGQHRFLCVSRVLGSPALSRRPFAVERIRCQPDELLVMHTDGLLTRAGLPEDPVLRRQHPVAMAQHLVEQFGRGYDDALALVCRL